MSSFRIVGKKQRVDPCYGLYDLYIDRDDIEALLSGKKLYSTVSYAEYAITIELEEKDDKDLPSVTPQEPRCKDCKWWKDSDGEYRRGCRAESKCPINRREVFEGNGYCYMFEPQESEDKE